MSFQTDDPAAFSEKVCRHLTGGGSVILRVYATKKKKQKYIIDTTKWRGHIDSWNPIDPEKPDSYHIGHVLLSESPKIRQNLTGIEAGNRYGIIAQDKDTSEHVATTVVLVGEEDDDEDEIIEVKKNPLEDLNNKIQTAFMTRLVNEISGQVTNITQPSHTTSGNFIAMGDGTMISKEKLIADLNDRVVRERRLEEEVRQLKAYNDTQQTQQQKPQSGVSSLLNVLGNVVSNYLANQGGGGQGGGLGGLGGLVNGLGGIPGLDALLGGANMAGVFRQPAGAAVGGATTAMPQANPFASLLANLDLNSLGAAVAQQQAPAAPVAAPSPKVEEPLKNQKEADVDVSDEFKKFAKALFDAIFQAFQKGGETEAKAIGASQLVPIADKYGITKSELQIMMMQGNDKFAEMLLNSLPTMVRAFIGTIRSQIHGVVINVLENVKWN